MDRAESCCNTSTTSTIFHYERVPVFDSPSTMCKINLRRQASSVCLPDLLFMGSPYPSVLQYLVIYI